MALIHVGGRVPEAHAIQLKSIQEETGKSESELVREAIAQFLGQTTPDSCASTSKRVSSLEKQLSKLQKLVLAD
ncbi:MAG: hypothetical protein AAGD25_01500 [Cyanobacteria bacterium P01_F01_bin.150]